MKLKLKVKCNFEIDNGNCVIRVLILYVSDLFGKLQKSMYKINSNSKEINK